MSTTKVTWADTQHNKQLSLVVLAACYAVLFHKCTSLFCLFKSCSQWPLQHAWWRHEGLPWTTRVELPAPVYHWPSPKAFHTHWGVFQTGICRSRGDKESNLGATGFLQERFHFVFSFHEKAINKWSFQGRSANQPGVQCASNYFQRQLTMRSPSELRGDNIMECYSVSQSLQQDDVGRTSSRGALENRCSELKAGWASLRATPM